MQKTNTKINISTGLILLISLTGFSGCSSSSQMGSSGLGGNSAAGIDNTLIIPPSLKVPASGTDQPVVRRQTKSAPTRQAQQSQNTSQPRKAVYQPSANYYIIVGTYPDQLDALDTFTRLSSIGLKGATMESRRTKAGSLLHMVRLGPYSKQEDIDKAKDSLTNTGMSQFKIVKN